MSTKPVKVRAREKQGITKVKILISHPMETGLRKDKKTGKPIPAHFIQEVICKHNGAQKATLEMGVTVSANPFINFEIEDGVKGDTLEVSWRDNLGETGSGSTTIS